MEIAEAISRIDREAEKMKLISDQIAKELAQAQAHLSDLAEKRRVLVAVALKYDVDAVTQTEEPVAEADASVQTQEPVAQADAQAQTQEPVAQADAQAQTEEPVAQADAQAQTQEPAQTEEPAATTEEPVAQLGESWIQFSPIAVDERAVREGDRPSNPWDQRRQVKRDRRG